METCFPSLQEQAGEVGGWPGGEELPQVRQGNTGGQGGAKAQGKLPRARVLDFVYETCSLVSCNDKKAFVISRTLSESLRKQ